MVGKVVCANCDTSNMVGIKIGLEMTQIREDEHVYNYAEPENLETQQKYFEKTAENICQRCKGQTMGEEELIHWLTRDYHLTEDITYDFIEGLKTESWACKDNGLIMF